jgi:putative tryptophan/tyrosine transport system substrate-binding protein
MVRRREFIAGLGAASAAVLPACWSRAARAQQPALPVVGFLNSQSADTDIVVAPFKEGLKEAGGFIEGRNVVIEYRWAENQIYRLPALAADLVRRRVAVIAAFSDAAAHAAKAATTTIPIAFTAPTDPVSSSLVASLNRPGGNVTGYVSLRSLLLPKQLQLLRELLPHAPMIGFLVDRDRPGAASDTKDLLMAADTLGQPMLVLNAGDDGELEQAFATFSRQHAGGVVISADPFYNRRMGQIATLAARYALPTIAPTREYAVAGGLMSYGNPISEAFRQVGVYVGRILKGASPADLPVEQATKIELTLNLKTAKALGLKMPTSLLVRAENVIE